MKASKKPEDDFEKRMARMKKWMNSKKGQAELAEIARKTDEHIKNLRAARRLTMEDLLRPYDI